MEKRISEWLSNRELLGKSYNFYLSKKIVIKINPNYNLSISHFEKAEYNLEFSYYLLKNEKFLDWAVVGLYYAIYHSSLALLIKKGFLSKNHNATLCFLMYYFSEFSEIEVRLFEDLILKKEEVKFYSIIKEERKKASYTTKIGFSKNEIEDLRERSIKFINKIKILLDK